MKKCEEESPRIKTSGKCGTVNRNKNPIGNDYIVGGDTTEENEYPWQVRVESAIKCGGSLLDDRTVLTAAHCTVGASRPSRVIVGLHNIHKFTEDQVFPVEEIINHPEYDGSRTPLRQQSEDAADMAILILSRRVEWSETVRPICLPTLEGTAYDGVMAITTGWGATQMPNEPTNLLREVMVKTMSSDECQHAYLNENRAWKMNSNNICTTEEFKRGGKSACHKDSGGPLIIEKQGSETQYELIGVVSGGPSPCAQAGVPTAYARVTSQLDWIKKYMAGETLRDH